MDVGYIWIDSLCIQQDDKSDWLHVSKFMGVIYSLAYCNIAADACSSSTQSLFRLRNPGTPIQFPTASKPEDIPSGEYWLKRFQYSPLDNTPLNDRAWVLQERLLAKRVLHFTERKIIWECRSLNASELWPSGIYGHHDTWLKTFWRTQEHEIAAGQQWQDQFRGYWYTVRNLYASTFLTVPDDRPIAISGIAKKFKDLLNDEYIVEMWKATLLDDLLWEVRGRVDDHPWSHPRKDRVYRPPSFSWLSLETATFAGRPSGNVKINHAIIVDVNIHYVTDDNTGLVHSGELRLTGLLRSVRIRLERNTRIEGPPYWRLKINGEDVQDVYTYPDFGRDELPLDSEGRQHYLFPLIEFGNVGGTNVMEGLVLELVSEETCKFRRIGNFRTTFIS